MNEHLRLSTNNDAWIKAQHYEAECQTMNMAHGDDYNYWWYKQFDSYRPLWGMRFDRALEVGCGPHTNIRYIMHNSSVKSLCLEDPLLQKYLSYNFGGSMFRKQRNQLYKLLTRDGLNVDFTSSVLEELPYRDGSFNLVVCINVLDHVQDYNKCMGEMRRVLAPGGLLVIGQDLSDAGDMERCPESYTDIGHPIKLDHETINQSLEGYAQVYYKLLSRGEGRNPRAHYGTLLGIYQKADQL